MRPMLTAAGRRLRRFVLLATVLALTAVVVPDASVQPTDMALVKIQSSRQVAHDPDVFWVLALGSDARPGDPVAGSRADAIQLVGINGRTGDSTAIGIPRDSYVNVPGYGRQKINSGMLFGGPQLMARAVGDMVGIQPDYVFVTSFKGFENMVNAIGGITVNSKYAFEDIVRPAGYRVGENRLNGLQAHIFARIRKSFPGGDFDRSANQQRTLLGILKEIRAKQERPGFIEKGTLAAAKNLETNVAPGEMYRIAQAAAQAKPGQFRRCVIQGGVGFAGAASVVFPDIGQARSIARRARNDAKLEGPC